MGLRAIKCFVVEISPLGVLILTIYSKLKKKKKSI